MAELWVGAGKPYASLTSAYAAAKSGDTIFVMAGTYTNETLAIWRDVNIVGVGGMAHFTSTVQIGNGKAIFVVNGDVTFENIEFSGATVRDGNGAGIRYESGDLTIKNSYFHDNQDGILAASSAGGTITIEGSEFARNGKGDGQTHGVYVNQISKLTIVDSYFHDTRVGHAIKSRADSTEIRNNVIDDGQGDSSYNIDLPNGGAATIVGNTIIQSATASNKYMIHYGGEVATPKPGAVLIANNDFIDYRTDYSVGVLNHTSKTIELKQNAFYGVDKDGESGPFSRIDNVTGVLGRSGADVIGTSGLDKVDYAFSPGAVNVNLATGVASDGYGSTDTLNGVEHAAGSRFADVITGSSGANWLDGGEGADRISGGAGDDLLVGGKGDDVIDGGAGIDTAVYSGKAADYRVSVSGGEVVVEALNGRTEGIDRLTSVERLRFADGTVMAPSVPTSPAPPANMAPTAAADQATTQSGQAALIDVLANDRDADGDALAISGLGAPQHGVAVVQNGKVLYTPTAGYAGADSFTYQASDGRGGLATGSVSVTVAAAPGQPVPPPAPQGLTLVGTAASEVLKGSGLDDLIQSGGGNDVVYAGVGDDVVEGGDGNDWLFGSDGDDELYGDAGNDMLDGGAGDDRLDGGTGDDELRGGDGDDTMVWSAGADRYYGGAGTDSILGGAGDDVMLLSSFGAANSVERIDGKGGQNVIQGNQYSNVLDFRGTELLNVARIDGGDGNDTIYGSAGDDVLVGGRGDDVIDGGAGQDVAVYQLRAADYRVTYDGLQVVVQALAGAEGVDRLTNVERLRFSDQVVAVSATPAPPANVAPTAAADQATTQSGQAALIDVLANDRDADGDALAISGLGAPQHGVAVVQNGKVLYTPTAGYAGADSFTYQASDGRGGLATGGVSVTVAAAPGQPVPSPAPQGLTVVGTAAGETLKGGALGDLIQSGGGNDVVYAGAGNDVVEGGDGNDWLFGSDGDDELYGDAGNDMLDGGAGDDRLDGGTGDDELRGGDGDDTMVWSAGADRYYGGAGMDSILGGAGDDVMLLSSFGAANSVERIDGKGGQNVIQGNQYSNVLDFRGTELLNVARIDGGSGNDTIYGSAGDDVLVGGRGGDLFVFGQGGGADTIADFLAFGEADRIDLSAFDLAGFAELRSMLVDSGSAVTIELAGADSVTLLGKRLDDISADHFLL